MGNSAVPKIDIQPEISTLFSNRLENVPDKLETFSSLLLKLKTDHSLSFFRNSEALSLMERNPANFKNLFLFVRSKLTQCADILNKEASNNQEIDPLLVGALLTMTRMIPVLIVKPRGEESKEGGSVGQDILWKTMASENGPPLIIKLVENISVLMFKPGFAVDTDPLSNFNKRRSMTGINEKLIWKRGIRLEKVSKKQQYIYDQNRCLLVRLAIVILSQPIYYAPLEHYRPSPLIALMTCKISRNSKNIFFSLINSCFNYDCDGMKIPYISAIQRHLHQEKLAELSAQLLNILLSGKPPQSQEELQALLNEEHSHWKDTYEYFLKEIAQNNKEMNLKSTDQRRPSIVKHLFVPKPETRDPVEEELDGGKKEAEEEESEIPDPRQIVKPKALQIEEERSPVAGNGEEEIDQNNSIEDEVPHIFNSHAAAQTTQDLQRWLVSNEYERILSIFESEHDFSVIIKGAVKLLSNSQRVENTTLPMSVRAIHFHQEMLLLLWRMITISTKFAFFLVKHPRLSKLVQSLIYHLHKGKSNPRKANTLYIVIFILFYLSQFETFSRNLNLPYSDSVHLEGMPPIEGSLADLIIISLCKALQKVPAQLASLHKIISGLICNIAPHIRFISPSASDSLIQIASIFSQNYPATVQPLRTILDAIDYTLYYQNKRNYNLILSVYQAPEVWKNLQSLSSKKQEQSPVQKDEQKLEEVEDERVQQKKEAWVEQSSSEIQQVHKEEEEPPSQAKEEPRPADSFESLRNIIVAANTMASFINQEKIGTRSGILKIMKQQKFSLLSERNQRQVDELLQQSPRELNEEPVREHKSNIKEINMTTQLLKREIYIVRYENNPLIDNWLQSFIWSVIFTQHFETKLFRAQKVKLFYVEIKEQ